MADSPVDLRSDILTRPSEAMIEAMTAAARTPSAFGLREDPFVQRLEARVAAVLGKEDALFCPTCTQANQIAVHLHCRAGDLVAAEADSHVFTSEAGAVAALTGVSAKPIPGEQGVMALGDLVTALDSGDALRSRVSLVLIENTHVRSGGCVVPRAAMAAQHAAALEAGIPVHVDGARLPNAALAEGVAMSELAAFGDSVSLSLNKGLGAPLGAALAGDREFVTAAERVRQRFGGGWRPAGIPAAAGLVALDDWETRLAHDHRRARRLAQTIAELPGVRVDLDRVQTNLVTAEVAGMSAQGLTAALAEQGVLALPYSATVVRLALYHDVDDDAVDRVVAAFRAVTRRKE